MKKYFFTIITLLFLWPLAIKAAQIYVWPQSVEGQIEETVLVELQLNSDVLINALDSTIYWDPHKLELMSITNGGSIFDLWVSDPQKHEFNSFRLVAGSTLGWQGSGGKIIGLLFKPLTTSSSTIIFSADTKLIRADGQGTQEDVHLLPGEIIVNVSSDKLPIINSYRIPDQNKWYSGKVFDIHWQVQTDFTYSYFLTHDPTQLPDDIVDGLVGDVQYEGLDDGIYYFVMKVWDENNNYLGKVIRRGQLDATPPSFTDIKVVRAEKEYKLSGNLFFAASDNLSGVAQVFLLTNGQADKVIMSPHTIARPWFFNKTFFLKVIDNASNYQTAPVVITALIPWWASVLGVIILIVILLLVLGKTWQKKSSSSW